MIDSALKDANILIVDDKNSNIDILEGLLEEFGYQNFKSTMDPRQVVSLFNSFKPDLILLDLMMPYLSGYEVMDQIKELVPVNTYLPILVLTADISREAKEFALSGGAKDFLSKPFDLNEVGLRIKNLLETRYLHQQLENQNFILEEKVKERTAELKKSNIDLISALEKAEESNELKSAFLRNISHEIRTPFNGLLGFMTMLQSDEVSKIERDEYIEDLNISANRLMNTLNAIIEISQIQSKVIKCNASKFNICNLADKLVGEFMPEAQRKGLEFKLNNNLPGNLELIDTDEGKAYPILSILINNAIKFTREGSIEFGFTIIKKPEGEVGWFDGAPEPVSGTTGLEFYVKDSGIGIAQDKLQIVFNHFRQADVSSTRPYDGTGLGLSIAKAYAEMLGGIIRVESEEGKGSVFYFTLPYGAEPELQTVAGNVVPEVAKKNMAENLKILIVEDDEISEKLIAFMVKTKSKEILIAKTGDEAVETFRNQPDIDVVLLDINLPKMDGYKVAREIRQFNKDVVIIAQTAYGLNDDREKAIAAGCNDYIAKPINQKLLIDLIQKWLNV